MSSLRINMSSQNFSISSDPQPNVDNGASLSVTEKIVKFLKKYEVFIRSGLMFSFFAGLALVFYSVRVALLVVGVSAISTFAVHRLLQNEEKYRQYEIFIGGDRADESFRSLLERSDLMELMSGFSTGKHVIYCTGENYDELFEKIIGTYLPGDDVSIVGRERSEG